MTTMTDAEMESALVAAAIAMRTARRSSKAFATAADNYFSLQDTAAKRGMVYDNGRLVTFAERRASVELARGGAL